MIQELDYTPPLPADIPQEMEKLAAELIKAAQVKAVSHDLFRYAAFIHNKIVEIYPYGEDDKLLARCATTYYIMTKDLPAVALSLSEQKYNSMISDHIKRGDLSDMAEAWQSEVLKRLQLMVQLTRY